MYLILLRITLDRNDHMFDFPAILYNANITIDYVKNITIGLGALCKRQISIYLEYKMECAGLKFLLFFVTL